MSQKELLRAAEKLAAEVSGMGRSRSVGQMVPMMIRVPIWVAARIDAMAKKTARSRAATVTMLCEVGLEEVQQLLDESVAARLVELESESYGELSEGETSSGEV